MRRPFLLNEHRGLCVCVGGFVWERRSKQSSQGLLPASCPEGDTDLWCCRRRLMGNDCQCLKSHVSCACRAPSGGCFAWRDGTSGIALVDGLIAVWHLVDPPATSCTVLLAIAPPLLTRWGEPAREGNIVSFFPLRHRVMKEHSPPRPRSRLSSPSPLTPYYPQTGGVKGGEGRLGDQRRSREQNTDQQQGGELMPRLLSIRNWPRAKNK